VSTNIGYLSVSVVRSFGTVQAVFEERLWPRHDYPTGHRPFPFKGISQAQAAAMRKEVSIEEYRRRIAKRMQSLERSEHAAIAPGRGRCGLRFPALRLVLGAKDEEGPVPPRQHGGIGEGADILADLTQIGIIDLELEPCILAGLPEQTNEKGAGLVNQQAFLFIPLISESAIGPRS